MRLRLCENGLQSITSDAPTVLPGPYLLFDGIHTTPQPPLVSAVLSVEPGAELAQLRAFLSP
jgi:hypothetical protein